MSPRQTRRPVPATAARPQMSLGAADPGQRRAAAATAMSQETAITGPLEHDNSGRLTLRPMPRVDVPSGATTVLLELFDGDLAVTPPDPAELGERFNDLVSYLTDLDLPAVLESLQKLQKGMRDAKLME